MKTLYLLNAPVLTTYGEFTFRPLTATEACAIVGSAENVVSAIGHLATANIISKILGVEVKPNRIEVRQTVGTEAIVFRLKQRPEEGRILSESEMDAIGYEFALLIKTAEGI